MSGADLLPGRRVRQGGRHGGELVIVAVRSSACLVRQRRTCGKSHKPFWLARATVERLVRREEG